LNKLEHFTVEELQSTLSQVQIELDRRKREETDYFLFEGLRYRVRNNIIQCSTNGIDWFPSTFNYIDEGSYTWFLYPEEIDYHIEFYTELAKYLRNKNKT
jgi:hypothetical protein